MRASLWADRLIGLLFRFLGLVILSAAIAAAIGSFLYNQAEEIAQADRVAMQFDARLRDQIAVLEGVRALYQSDKVASGPGIRSYLAALQPEIRVPGMQGVGIAIAMQQATPAAAETQLRENYNRDIKVWPDSDEPIGFPIVLLEPGTATNVRALGFDMFSEPTRRQAMRRAWQSGQPAASGIVQLVQEDGTSDQPGFLIYVPAYASPEEGGVPAVVEPSGNQAIEAFVYAPFRTHDLATAVLGAQLDKIDGIEIVAGVGPSAPVVFGKGRLGWDVHENSIRVADQQWTMRISYGRLLERLGRPFAILTFGILMAFLATKLHSVQRRRITVFQELAEEKARHAEDRELMIGEMAHRMKNAFARIGALARITVREAGDLETFETLFDGRMRALSNAKQLLVTGAVDTVELGEIVRKELQIAGWPDDKVAALTGPIVRLEDEAAQAIALALHEIVTNSIKYGALADRGDLSVEWVRENGDVELRWTESKLSETPVVDQESFGSHFIRSLIERQLKGSWNRSAADHSLTIFIRWPHHDRAA